MTTKGPITTGAALQRVLDSLKRQGYGDGESAVNLEIYEDLELAISIIKAKHPEAANEPFVIL